jgi:hypothetical protein
MLNSVASRSMLWQIDIILEPLKEFMTSSVLTFEKSYNVIQYDHGLYSCEPRVKQKSCTGKMSEVNAIVHTICVRASRISHLNTQQILGFRCCFKLRTSHTGVTVYTHRMEQSRYDPSIVLSSWNSLERPLGVLSTSVFYAECGRGLICDCAAGNFRG